MPWDNDGNWVDYPEDSGSSPQAPAASPPQSSAPVFDWGAEEARLKAAAGSLYDPSDLEGLKRNTSYSSGSTNQGQSIEEARARQMAVYDSRRASTSDRSEDSQSSAGNALYGSGSGNTSNTPGGSFQAARPSTPRFQNSSPRFDDPTQRLIEDYALNRQQHLTNPDPNSGTALFEKYARELIETLRGPVYSPQDEAVLKTRATDAIESERSATKARWMEVLSMRGITPSSGVALDGLLKIENHFNSARTVFEREFAADAINATRAQRVQALDTTGQLADSEEGRLREAGTYAAMPYGLEEDAFQRNLQMMGMGGSPSQMIQSLLGIQSAGQQSDALRSSNRAALSSGLLQYLGYMFA